MAVIKALLFAVVVINIQDAFSTYIHLDPISSKASTELKRVINRERDALLKAVEKKLITKSEYDAAIDDFLENAKKDEMCTLSKVDVALGRAVQSGDIDQKTRAKIILHCVGKNLHLREIPDVRTAVATYVNAARDTGVITERTAVQLRAACPKTIAPFGSNALGPEHV